MRRFLSEAFQYVIGLPKAALAGWDAFFFAPADPLPLGLIRIGVGLLLFWNVAVLGFDLADFLGPDGWIGPGAIRQYLSEHAPRAWSLWFWVPDRGLVAAWGGCLVVIALFTAGFASRLTAILAWGVAVSIDRRAPAAAFGFDHMLSMWLFYLAAFGASGASLSLDAVLARRRRKPGGPEPDGAPASVPANLTLRLIQLHLALVYGSAGLAKLAGPEWWDGTALEMLLMTPEFKRWDLSGLLAYPLLLNFATHTGLAIEVAYPVLIWNARLRPLLLFLVASMHLGIDLLLGLTEFGLAMVVANLAFVPGGWLRSLRSDRHAPADEEGRVAATPARSHPADEERPPARGRRRSMPTHR